MPAILTGKIIDEGLIGRSLDKLIYYIVLSLLVFAACGGEAKVPFEPKSDRPVYCSDCFARMREEN